MTDVDGNEELIQIAERQLADAEEAYRLDPSDANQRRIMRACQQYDELASRESAGATKVVPPIRTSSSTRCRIDRPPTVAHRDPRRRGASRWPAWLDAVT
jgi:hypothetical protein